MPTNRTIEKYLYEAGYISASDITNDLINGGFIEKDKLTKPEELAEKAKSWIGGQHGPYGNRRLCGAADAFDKASGWSTDSWRVIASEDPDGEDWEWKLDTPNEIKYIFEALVILAREAGIEL